MYRLECSHLDIPLEGHQLPDLPLFAKESRAWSSFRVWNVHCGSRLASTSIIGGGGVISVNFREIDEKCAFNLEILGFDG